MKLGSNEAIKQAVVLGMTVLTRLTLALDAPMGQFAILDVDGFPIQRQWYVVHARGKQLSIVARTFHGFLKQSPEHVIELPCVHTEQGSCSLLPEKKKLKRIDD